MSKTQSLKSELEEIEGEIYSLKERKWDIEDELEEIERCEKYEPSVIATLNRNYNKWCSKDYLVKNFPWDETDLNPDDDIEKVLMTCDALVEKGVIQEKEAGVDWRGDNIYDYRITDTETRDMFAESEVKK